MPSKPQISDPELKRELEGKDVDRLRGRPRGTGQGRTTRRYGISIPLDLADWLDTTGSPSATIVRALRLLRDQEKPARRRR